MPNYILYITSSLDEVYECAYSILKYLGVYNLKPPADHSLFIYTNHPELLEAYGSFFNDFELKSIPENSSVEFIIKKFKEQYGTNILYLRPDAYPVIKFDEYFLMNAENIGGFIEHYKDFKEFKILLKDFFKKYQEESVPNQVKLMQHIDAKRIQNEKNKFQQLPFLNRLIRKAGGKAWNISDYFSKI